MSFEVKKLQETDLPLAKELIEVWQEDDGIENGKIPSDTHLINSLTKEHYQVYVALEHGKVRGGLAAYEFHFFDVEETEMFIYELGVSKHHRRKGIAKQLIDTLKEHCKDKGIKVLFVATEMDNEIAKKVYENTQGELEVVAWYTYKLGKK